jgi:hypothetical protein
MQGHKLVGQSEETNSMHWGGGDISDETTITSSVMVIKKDMNIFQL